MSFFRRRLALFMTVLPVACYAYACSSDDPSPPLSEEDAGTDGGGTKDEEDSSSPVDSGGKIDSGNGDAGDAGDAGDDGGVVLECLGNPLTADGGSPDAGVVIPFASLKAIATGLFLDGPQFIDDGTDAGAIVYSEVTAQRIVRNGPDGGARVVLRATGEGNLPIGNAHVDNFIYTTLARETGGGGGILRMLVDGGSPTGFDGGPANSPNDAVASSKGFIYFTDPNWQAGGPSTGVYRMAPDGGVTTITTFNGGLANRADGIALTKDGTTLYVGLFDQRTIRKYTVDANGAATYAADFAFVPANNPTGIAVDIAGNLWIAENVDDATEGLIEIVSPAGKKWGEIPFPDSKPTGIAFGGADNKTAYITTERGIGNVDGTLYVLPTRCAGVR
ncbi:MAG: hypothetical protein BGO98_40520 [Myxococcales bacterium 68-20]|nr:SMP-30/gluconolactonase/LRE family protein [Myxococcales bacterium]OJY19759.1 MAG: hypothetical protein BGO98_40520 [Myxococcales bacterium 68-20]